MAQSQMQPPVHKNGATAAVQPIGPVGQRNHVYAAAMVRLVADTALLSLAALVGFLVDIYYFGDDPTMEHREVALWIPILFVFTSVVLLKLFGSSHRSSHGFIIREWAQTAGIISLASVIVWGITNVTLHMQPNGEVAAAVWGSAVVLLPIGRSIVGSTLRSRGIGCTRIVVVGDVDRALPIMQQMEKNRSNFKVVGMVSPAAGGFTQLNANGHGSRPISLQALNSLPEVIKDANATDLLIAVTNGEYEKVRAAVRETVPANVTVHVALDPLLQTGIEGRTELADGVAAVRFRGRTMSWQYESLKRMIDIIAASALLLMTSPLIAMTAIAIKLDSSGPVFFKQTRVGRRGARFGMYKFRSMKVNAEAMLPELMARNEAAGKMFKMKNDPRVTRVGKFLRKSSIDELPQLFNVLNGSMSLVGPRPPLPKEVAEYEESHYERLEGVPGITGLWQIRRGPVLDFEEMVAYDIEYLDSWSLWKDITIMLRTIPTVLSGRGAY